MLDAMLLNCHLKCGKCLPPWFAILSQLVSEFRPCGFNNFSCKFSFLFFLQKSAQKGSRSIGNVHPDISLRLFYNSLVLSKCCFFSLVLPPWYLDISYLHSHLPTMWAIIFVHLTIWQKLINPNPKCSRNLLYSFQFIRVQNSWVDFSNVVIEFSSEIHESKICASHFSLD